MPPPPDCLANSLMSKPALNFELAPVTTIALTSGEECASRRQLNRALSTAWQQTRCAGHDQISSHDRGLWPPAAQAVYLYNKGDRGKLAKNWPKYTHWYMSMYSANRFLSAACYTVRLARESGAPLTRHSKYCDWATCTKRDLHMSLERTVQHAARAPAGCSAFTGGFWSVTTAMPSEPTPRVAVGCPIAAFLSLSVRAMFGQGNGTLGLPAVPVSTLVVTCDSCLMRCSCTQAALACCAARQGTFALPMC